MTPVAPMDGSRAGGRQTATVPRAVAAAADPDAARVVSVAATGMESAGDAAEAADVVVGSPVYRASFGHPLRGLLDHLPRGMGGECRAPLRGKAVCMVATGAGRALAASSRLEPQA